MTGTRHPAAHPQRRPMASARADGLSPLRGIPSTPERC